MVKLKVQPKPRVRKPKRRFRGLIKQQDYHGKKTNDSVTKAKHKAW